MADIKYKLIYLGDEGILTVVSPEGELLVATTTSHKNFEELVAATEAGDLRAFDLFEAGKAIVRKFADVANGRLAVRSGQVYYDDDPLDLSISDKILAFYEADEDFSPLARYVENVMANPQVESREQFYRWIAGESHHFPISDDGCIVAYKGVRANGDDTFTSISSGRAFVNGAEKNGRIPNAVGDVVTMPRSEVEFNPDVHCHVGLHAGTWEYASNFAQGAVMLVKINPRDVVSVPRDHNSEKVRVCRYEVIGFAKTKNEALRYVDENTTLDVKSEPVAKDVENDVQDDKPVLPTVRVEDSKVTTVRVEGTKVTVAEAPLARQSRVHRVGDKVTLRKVNRDSVEVGKVVTVVDDKESHYLAKGSFRADDGRAYWDNEAVKVDEPKRLPRVADKTPVKVAGVFTEGDPVVVKRGRYGNRSLFLDGGPQGSTISDYVGRRGVYRGKHAVAKDAGYVYVGGDKLGLWLDEIEHDPKGSSRSASAKVDTRTNHLRQKRGPGGRFVKAS